MKKYFKPSFEHSDAEVVEDEIICTGVYNASVNADDFDYDEGDTDEW